MRVRLRAAARHPVLYRGERFACPCCGGSFGRLAPQGGRRNARCPRCWSAERHRLLWLYVERETDLLSVPRRVLHFAPEAAIAERLAAQPQLEYVSADLAPGAAMVVMDITDIPAADGSYDVVIVSHVLEHIPDDARAMRELHRVLAPGGQALLQHPVDYARDTYEDWSITTPEGRERAFLQDDHVRIYGRDLEQRLRAAGFDVAIRRYREELSPQERERFCLDEGTDDQRSDDLYVCTKP